MTNTTLAFGAYDPNSVGALDQSATFTLSCTKGTTATIGLNAGVNGTRNMKGAALPNDLLSYQLFQDTNRTTAWDTTTTLAVAASTGVANTLTVYGRIPVAQFVTADSYSDTVTATVNF
jgi:spore coat protein U-like protein